MDSAHPDPDQGHARQWPSTPYSDEARQPVPPISDATSVALFGDCTVACSYFPPANRPENHLLVRLRRKFPEHSFIINNYGADGDSAENFISSGRALNILSTLPRLDVAFIRYGINDRKTAGIAGCIDNLAKLSEMIRQAFPSALLIIETGIYVDFPEHYLWDRNASLAPLYLAMAEWAQSAGHPVLDIFSNLKKETEAGNWDLRVRGLPTSEHLIVDDSFDPFFGEDPAFFTNIHPNSRCLALIASWQTELLALQDQASKKTPSS